jgi:hypothetical protein
MQPVKPELYPSANGSLNRSFEVDPLQLSLHEENILKMLGVPADKADSYVLGLIRELIQQCLEIATPLAGWSLFKEPRFIPDPGSMILAEKTFHLNRIVNAALGKSTEIAVFIGTCGKKVEALSKQLIKDGHLLEGLVADLIGSEIAEGIAEYIHKSIAHEMAERGVRVTNRYSPGYCNWPVSDQQQLFGLMGNNNCQVHLTKTSLMVPIKSVSGIIGVGKEVENAGYTCDICEVGYCIYREKRRK